MRERVRLPRGPGAVGAAVVAGLAAIIILLASSGGSEDEQEPARPASAPAAPPARGGSFLGRLVPAARERSGEPPVVRKVTGLSQRMSLERKVAQLFLLGFPGDDLTDPIFDRLERRDIGGLVLEAPNVASSQQVGSLAAEATAIADRSRRIRPFLLVAQEGGDFSAIPGIPPARPPAGLRSIAEAARVATATARSLRGLGLNGLLGPVVDVGPEDGGAVGPRAYSDDPRDAGAYGTATIARFKRARLLTAAKHFPGLGAASQSTDEGPATVGLRIEQIRARDLRPFRAAIRAGVPAVVIGHGLYSTDDFITPASLSPAIATGLLREELRFPGLAISDDLAAPAVSAFSPAPRAAVEAIRAGVDMVFLSGPPEDQEAAYRAVLGAVREGRIPRARLEEAVNRVLRAKRDYAVIREPPPEPRVRGAAPQQRLGRRENLVILR